MRSHIPPQRYSPVGAEQSWLRIHHLMCMRGLVAVGAEMTRGCMGWVVPHRRRSGCCRTDRCTMFRHNAVVVAVVAGRMGHKTAGRAVLQLYDLKEHRINVVEEDDTRRTYMTIHRRYDHIHPVVHKGPADVVQELQVPQGCYTHRVMRRNWLAEAANVAVLDFVSHWRCKPREHMR